MSIPSLGFQATPLRTRLARSLVLANGFETEDYDLKRVMLKLKGAASFGPSFFDT
jgi:hypothetical protein